jgi:hypothetical protein
MIRGNMLHIYQILCTRKGTILSSACLRGPGLDIGWGYETCQLYILITQEFARAADLSQFHKSSPSDRDTDYQGMINDSCAKCIIFVMI